MHIILWPSPILQTCRHGGDFSPIIIPSPLPCINNNDGDGDDAAALCFSSTFHQRISERGTHLTRLWPFKSLESRPSSLSTGARGARSASPEGNSAHPERDASDRWAESLEMPRRQHWLWKNEEHELDTFLYHLKVGTGNFTLFSPNLRNPWRAGRGGQEKSLLSLMWATAAYLE